MNQIQFGNITAKLITTDRNILNAVYDSLVYEMPGYQFTKAFKDGRWDGKIRMFKQTDYTFPAGMVRWVQKIIMMKGLDVEFLDLRDSSKKVPGLSKLNIENILEGKKLRDYQIKATKRIFALSRGIIQSPTGSGKTVIAAGIAKIAMDHGLRVLFCTHQKKLLHQTQKSFIESGIDAGIIGDGERIFKQVSIASIPTLYMNMPVSRPSKIKMMKGKPCRIEPVRRAGDPQITSWMKGVDMLIFDEAHLGDANSFQACGQACSNAYYRIGLSATPMMKGIEADMKLIALTGDVVFKITLKDLIERGLLAQPYIKFNRVTTPNLHKDKAGRKINYQFAYRAGIVENSTRNEKIVGEAANLAAAGESVLILVNQIKHGKHLLNLLRVHYAGLASTFIHGDKDDEVREKAFNGIENGRLNILIASTIMDLGVDLPGVSSVIMAGGGKSGIKIYQRIGRAMRPKKGQNRCLIVDFIDLTNPHLASHSLQRFNTIKSEPGFIPVKDFSLLLQPICGNTTT